MPWGKPHRLVLPDADRRILLEVHQTTRDLMDKLSELETYVLALNEEIGIQRTHGTGECDDGSTTITR